MALHRKEEEELLKYFTFEDGLVFCNDIHHLLLNVCLLEYKSEEWRFLVESLK